MTNTPHTPEIIQDKYGDEIEVSRATVESLLAQRNELREALQIAEAWMANLRVELRDNGKADMDKIRAALAPSLPAQRNELRAILQAISDMSTGPLNDAAFRHHVGLLTSSPVKTVSPKEWMDEGMVADKVKTQRNELLEALKRLAAWFKANPDNGAFSSSEHLLGGCANELLGDIERARAALAKANP